ARSPGASPPDGLGHRQDHRHRVPTRSAAHRLGQTRCCRLRRVGPYLRAECRLAPQIRGGQVTSPRCRLVLTMAALALLRGAQAQTTDAIISGQVYDRLTGRRIAGAKIHMFHLDTGTDVPPVVSGSSGFYAYPRLSPGTYSLRVEKDGYQSLETTELRLFVAGRLDLDLPLRPLTDIYSEKSYFNRWAGAYGP